MIIVVSGQSGAGKDTIADFLVQDYGFIKISFADPLKRFCMEVFDWTPEQLWGPSENRNKADERYTRSSGENLSPRWALQKLGADWGRECWPEVWANYVIKTYDKLNSGAFEYDPKIGVYPSVNDKRLKPKTRNIVIADCRYKNEMELLKERGVFIRVKRPVSYLGELESNHSSEKEQKEISDDEFDIVINNDGTIDDLYANVKNFLSSDNVMIRLNI